MRDRRITKWSLVFLIGILCSVWMPALVRPSPAQDHIVMKRETLGAGGMHRQTSTSFVLFDTIGQCPIGPARQSSSFWIADGFWPAVITDPLTVPDDPDSPNEDSAPSAFDVRFLGPNPTPGSVRLRVAVSAAENVSLAIYSADGRLVKTLLDGTLSIGWHAFQWDGLDGDGHRVSSGLYFVLARHGSTRLTGRLIVLE